MAKAKRPSVLDDYMVGGVRRTVEKTPENLSATMVKLKPGALRTSIYFDRRVHDQLRAIAFEKRKSVAGVIHEALDDFFAKHGFPTTGEIRSQ